MHGSIDDEIRPESRCNFRPIPSPPRDARVTGDPADATRRSLRTAMTDARLQQVRRQLGELAALTLGEDDMAAHLLVAERVRRDGQAVRRAVDVRIVDLPRIAGEHDLRPVAG